MPNLIKTSPLKEQQLELLRKPPIKESFPVTFKGGMTYTAISAFCLQCDQEIDDNELRGDVKSVLPQMTQVEACGYCAACNLVTSISYRLYSDGRFMGIKNGKWMTWQMKSAAPWWKKIFNLLFK